MNGCEPQLGETCATCPADCACVPPQVCNFDLQVCADPPPCDGDGVCEAGENPENCPNDCFCGDTVCSDPFETCVSCEADCPLTPGCEAPICCAPGEVVHPVLGICILEACLECPEGMLCDLDTGECLPGNPGGGFETQGFEFFHVDALGSVRLVTNEAGGVISRHDYLPFGEQIPADMGSRAGIPEYGGNPTVPIRFTGKERDVETGLDYFGARYLSGAQARFISADPVFNLQASIANPQRWNRYAYVSNNPLARFDPTGGDERHVAGQAGELLAERLLTEKGSTIVLSSARKAVNQGGVDFIAVKGAEVLVADNKALAREVAYSASALTTNLRQNLVDAQAEMIERLIRGGLTAVEEAATKTAIEAIQKDAYQLAVTGAGGAVKRVGPRLAAKGITFRILGAIAIGLAFDTAAFALDANAANVGADFANAEERRSANLEGLYRRWRAGENISEAERQYLRRLAGLEDPRDQPR